MICDFLKSFYPVLVSVQDSNARRATWSTKLRSRLWFVKDIHWLKKYTTHHEIITAAGSSWVYNLCISELAATETFSWQIVLRHGEGF